MAKQEVAQVSGRGTITLPADIRKQLGLTEGDLLAVGVSGRSIVLTPALLTKIELYTDERIKEFEEAGYLTDEELAAIDKAWGLSRP